MRPTHREVVPANALAREAERQASGEGYKCAQVWSTCKCGLELTRLQSEGLLGSAPVPKEMLLCVAGCSPHQSVRKWALDRLNGMGLSDER
jgi:hypothetical protein